MSRPKRKAAAAAQERMQQIFEWEQAPENSKLFRDCAAAIDAEFERERKSKRVKVEEIEDSEECEAVSCDEEHAEEITQEDIDFVEQDGYTAEDAEWVPEKHKSAKAGAGNEPAEAETGDGASEESSEEDDAEEESKDACGAVARDQPHPHHRKRHARRLDGELQVLGAQAAAHGDGGADLHGKGQLLKGSQNWTCRAAATPLILLRSETA